MKLQRRVLIIAKNLIMPSLNCFKITLKIKMNLSISNWANRSQKNSKNSNLYSECAHILLISPQSPKLNISTAPELHKIIIIPLPFSSLTRYEGDSKQKQQI